jgi:hypothetical protein
MRNYRTINCVSSNLVCSGYHKFCQKNLILVRVFPSIISALHDSYVGLHHTVLLPFFRLLCFEFEMSVDGPEEVHVHFT